MLQSKQFFGNRALCLKIGVPCENCCVMNSSTAVTSLSCSARQRERKRISGEPRVLAFHERKSGVCSALREIYVFAAARKCLSTGSFRGGAETTSDVQRVSYMNTNTRERGNNNIIVAFECSGKLFRNSGCENKKWLNAARCHQKWRGRGGGG